MKGQAIRVIFGTSVGTLCPNKGQRRLVVPVSRGAIRRAQPRWFLPRQQRGHRSLDIPLPTRYERGALAPHWIKTGGA